MIVLILFLAFLLRLVNLNQSFWLDEAITALAVKNNTFWEIITRFSPGDFHPPLYYLILKLWTNLFGYSEIALRLPSVFFGAVATVFVYKIGKRLFNRKIGLLAALFLAINPLAVYYSQEARMYSLAMLAVTAAVYFFISRRWLLFILSLIVAVYTDYLPVLILPVFFLVSDNRKRFFIFCFLFFVLFLPWVSIFLAQLEQGAAASQTAWGDVLGRITVKNLLLIPIKFIFGRISLDNKFLYAAVVTLISSVYLFILARARSKILWGWLLIPIILGVIISVKIPLLMYFRFLFVLPAFVLLLAAGCGRGKVFIVFIIIINFISFIFFNLSPRFWREDWRAAAGFVNEEKGEALLPSLAQAAPLTYYAPGIKVMDRETVNLSGAGTVYLFRYVQEIFDPENVLRYKLEGAGYDKTGEKIFNGVVVWKYQNAYRD